MGNNITLDPNITNTALINEKFKSLGKQNISQMQQDKLKLACDDFEAFFMQQFLDISLKNSKIAGNDTGSEIIKGMYVESLSKVGAGDVGISDILYQYLTRNKKG
jgi:Rod binding domain-containing protein